MKNKYLGFTPSLGMFLYILFFTGCGGEKLKDRVDDLVNDPGSENSSGLWVPIRIGSCSGDSFPSVFGNSFDQLAEAGCPGIQSTYSGQKECRGGVPWIKCDSTSSPANNSQGSLVDETSTPAPSVEVTSKRFMLKTGQRESFEDFYGDSFIDDGYYQKGSNREYIRNDTQETVAEYVTGLDWQDDDDKYSKKDLKEAINYCRNLNSGGFNDWRVPSLTELATLAKWGSKPYYDSVFQNMALNTSSKNYWTVEQDKINDSILLSSVTIDFKNGKVQSRSSSEKNYSRCVRGSRIRTQGAYVRDHDSNTVVDQTTSLVWQDSPNSIRRATSVKHAISFCERSKLGGYEDWRLPNINELMSLGMQSENPVFEYIGVSFSYWSSTRVANDFKYWAARASGHPWQQTYMTDDYVRCVRTSDE